MYSIHASIRYESGQWHGVRHLPTFYLDSRVQGIVDSTHAIQIATAILDPFYELGDRLNIHTAKV